MAVNVKPQQRGRDRVSMRFFAAPTSDAVGDFPNPRRETQFYNNNHKKTNRRNSHLSLPHKNVPTTIDIRPFYKEDGLFEKMRRARQVEMQTQFEWTSAELSSADSVSGEPLLARTFVMLSVVTHEVDKTQLCARDRPQFDGFSVPNEQPFRVPAEVCAVAFSLKHGITDFLQFVPSSSRPVTTSSRRPKQYKNFSVRRRLAREYERMTSKVKKMLPNKQSCVEQQRLLYVCAAQWNDVHSMFAYMRHECDLMHATSKIGTRHDLVKDKVKTKQLDVLLAKQCAIEDKQQASTSTETDDEKESQAKVSVEKVSASNTNASTNLAITSTSTDTPGLEAIQNQKDKSVYVSAKKLFIPGQVNGGKARELYSVADSEQTLRAFVDEQDGVLMCKLHKTVEHRREQQNTPTCAATIALYQIHNLFSRFATQCGSVEHKAANDLLAQARVLSKSWPRPPPLARIPNTIQEENTDLDEKRTDIESPVHSASPNVSASPVQGTQTHSPAPSSIWPSALCTQQTAPVISAVARAPAPRPTDMWRAGLSSQAQQTAQVQGCTSRPHNQSLTQSQSTSAGAWTGNPAPQRPFDQLFPPSARQPGPVVGNPSNLRMCAPFDFERMPPPVRSLVFHNQNVPRLRAVTRTPAPGICSVGAPASSQVAVSVCASVQSRRAVHPVDMPKPLAEMLKGMLPALSSNTSPQSASPIQPQTQHSATPSAVDYSEGPSSSVCRNVELLLRGYELEHRLAHKQTDDAHVNAVQTLTHTQQSPVNGMHLVRACASRPSAPVCVPAAPNPSVSTPVTVSAHTQPSTSAVSVPVQADNTIFTGFSVRQKQSAAPVLSTGGNRMETTPMRGFSIGHSSAARLHREGAAASSQLRGSSRSQNPVTNAFSSDKPAGGGYGRGKSM